MERDWKSFALNEPEQEEPIVETDNRNFLTVFGGDPLWIWEDFKNYKIVKDSFVKAIMSTHSLKYQTIRFVGDRDHDVYRNLELIKKYDCVRLTRGDIWDIIEYKWSYSLERFILSFLGLELNVTPELLSKAKEKLDKIDRRMYNVAEGIYNGIVNRYK